MAINIVELPDGFEPSPPRQRVPLPPFAMLVGHLARGPVPPGSDPHAAWRGDVAELPVRNLRM